MNILLVTHFAPPERNEGTENYTLGLAKTLHARGHQVNLVCATGWSVGDDYWNGVTCDQDSGVPIHRIHLNWTKAHNPNQVLYYSATVEAWFNEFLGQLQPDIVHVTSTYSLGTGVLKAAASRNIPTILTLMDFWFLCPRTVLMRSDGALCDGRTTPQECQRCVLATSNLYNRTRGILPDFLETAVWREAGRLPYVAAMPGVRGVGLDMADRKKAVREAMHLPNVILSHSHTVQEMFAQANLDGVNIAPPVQYLRNGHDFAWAENYHGKSASDVVRFGYMGQIAATKGVHLLIEAFQKLPKNSAARLDIWGDLTKDAAYVHRLQELAGDNPAISLRGRFERENLGQVLAAMDVIVVPSTWLENAPLVIYEAFATQTPVITTNIGGMAEAISHEHNGLLFERNDVDDLSRQLSRVIFEPRLLAQMQQGTPQVKTVDEEIDELEQLYGEVVMQKHGEF